MKRPLLAIFLIVLVDVLGLTILIPLLPFYAESFGASATAVGLLQSTYAGCQLIAGPPLGSLSDRLGRKPVLLVSQLGTFAGFLILASAHSLPVVFLARAIDGLTAGNLSIAQAYIADVTTPKERMSAFGLIGIAFGVGFVLGPAASGYLSAHYGYHVPIFCAAGLSFMSILGTAFLLPSVTAVADAAQPAAPLASEEEAPVAPGGRRLRILDWKIYGTYFRRPVLGGLLWEFFLYTFAFAVFMGGFALFAERRQGLLFGTKQVGYVLTYSGILGVLIQGSIRSKRVHKFGEVNLVTLGFALGTIGYALLGLTYGIPLLLVAATFSSIGNGLVRPALTSLITQQVGREEQGVVLGLNQSLQSISQIVGQGLAGFLIEHLLLSTWAFWAAGVTLLALILNRGSRGERIAATQGA